jgi:molybdopterin/thiamine biosynthesis adenylyltransferase/rhodanese-related sulfurtransferase
VTEPDANKLRETIPRLTIDEARERVGVFVDVREREEFAAGVIEGAIELPRGLLELEAPAKLPDKRKPVFVYCQTGVRSLFAAETLLRMGYEEVYSVDGGYEAWNEAGYPISGIDDTFDREELRRYARHLIVPEVGLDGQKRLKEARVLLVGAGGLGSPAALYLAAAGVGTLGIVDPDVVDGSNLQRQVLHATSRIGTPKVESARATIREINPHVDVVAYEERLDSSNADRIVPEYDAILDGADNFPTRYLVNDACVKHGKPNVHGSVFRFEGQVSLFHRGHGPCYRCLYPDPPPPGAVPSCAEAGVLGVLPGVIGLLQAVETVKLILGKGDLLYGRLLVYDALAASLRELKVRANPRCAYCAEGVEFPGYVDYDGFCGL